MRKRGTVCGRSVGIYAGDRASGGCPPLSRKAHPRGVCDEAGAQVPPYLTPLRETFNAVRRVARAGRPGDPRLRGFAPWVTVRHRGISPSCYLDQKRLSALRFPVCGGGHKERERDLPSSPACAGGVGRPGGGLDGPEPTFVSPRKPYPDNTSWMYPLKMYSWAPIFPDVSQGDRTLGQTYAGLVQET